MKLKLSIYLLGVSVLNSACNSNELLNVEQNIIEDSIESIDIDTDTITTIDSSAINKALDLALEDFISSEIKSQVNDNQLAIAQKSNKSILDYYLLLPASPYFDNEIDDANIVDREAGIRYINEKAGYLVGGHSMGPEFTMVLFKNKEANIDYIMLHRPIYAGDMFGGFFNFYYFTTEEGWKVADSLLNIIDNKIFREYLLEMQNTEYSCSVVLPEIGTEVEFRKWNPNEGKNQKEGTLLFKSNWNGLNFDFINAE